MAEIATIGWFAGQGWVRSRDIAAAQREETRTHTGPLFLPHHDIVRDDALRLLAELPPLKSLGGDAARFVAMPSFGRQWFAIAVRADGNSAHGLLMIMQHSGSDDFGAATIQAFDMPVSAYKDIIAQTHRLADGWDGEGEFWTDGAPFAFELIHGPNVISGIGNSPTHYRQIALAVRNGLAPYVQAIARLDDDWVSRQAAIVR